MEDKIWFTYKARIEAHKRLSWLDFHSQLLMIWFAVLNASVAVVMVRYPQALGPNTDVLLAVLAIALFGLSMTVANRDFRGRAISMRQNYLDLHRLYDQLKQSGTPSASDLQRYHDLLSSVENHQEIDDKLFRVLHAKTLNSRKPNNREYVEVYSYLVMRICIIASFYFSPLLVWRAH